MRAIIIPSSYIDILHVWLSIARSSAICFQVNNPFTGSSELISKPESYSSYQDSADPLAAMILRIELN